MKIDRGNLWTYSADFRVITTNGIVKHNGRLTMGKGVALEAKKLFPDIDKFLGHLVHMHGNHVYVYNNIICFPTKHNWKDKSDLVLIEQSLNEMCNALKYYKYRVKRNNISIVLPPVGCGNGGLDFETQVRPLLEKYLDDRFTVLI